MLDSYLESVSHLKNVKAKELFHYAAEQIELEVGEQTSITMNNQHILLRFGKSTILMNEEGIWLDAAYVGVNEKNPVHQNADMDFEENELSPDCLQSLQQLHIKGK